MTELSRRAMLGSAALGGAGIAASSMGMPMSVANAAAPAADKQVPGYYRYKIGSYELTAVTDGARSFPLPDKFVVNKTKEEVSAALKDAFMPADTMTIPFTPLLVNTGSKLVLIDTGSGPGAMAGSKNAVGQLHSNLAAAGIDLKAIDAVIITHFHGDHINGLLDAEGKSAFTNAEIMVPANEWAFWSDESNASKAPENQKGNFANMKKVFGAYNNKVTKYEDKKELIPGVTAVSTPGHTPGHMSILIASGNDSVMNQADVSNHPALFVRNPGWHAGFDMDGPMAEQTRRKLYDRLAADRTRLQGFHFPFPANGYLEKQGDGYRLIPAPWSPVI